MKAYRIRYSVEPGNWIPPPATKKSAVVPGVTFNHPTYGYADDVFILSTVVQPDGELSHLPLGTFNGEPEFPPSREMMLRVKEMVDHYLEHHAK